MKKVIRLLCLSISVLLLIVACGDDTTDEISNGNDFESAITEEKEHDQDNNGNADEDYDLLSIGETGLMETAIGDFEVTVTSFSFVDEVEKEDPYQYPDNGTFVLVDMEIKNVGDEPLSSADVARSRLYNETGAGIASANVNSFSSIDQFPENIEPDETVAGQLIVDHSQEDYYELSVGANHLESLTNEIRWALNADDAE